MTSNEEVPVSEKKVYSEEENRDAARELLKEYIPDMNSLNRLLDDSLTMKRVLNNDWTSPSGDIDPKAFLDARLASLNETRKAGTQDVEGAMVAHSDPHEKETI